MFDRVDVIRPTTDPGSSRIAASPAWTAVAKSAPHPRSDPLWLIEPISRLRRVVGGRAAGIGLDGAHRTAVPAKLTRVPVDTHPRLCSRRPPETPMPHPLEASLETEAIDAVSRLPPMPRSQTDSDPEAISPATRACGLDPQSSSNSSPPCLILPPMPTLRPRATYPVPWDRQTDRILPHSRCCAPPDHRAPRAWRSAQTRRPDVRAYRAKPPGHPRPGANALTAHPADKPGRAHRRFELSARHACSPTAIARIDATSLR